MIAALDIGGTHVSAARVDAASGVLDAATRRTLQLPLAGSRAELLDPILRATVAVSGPDTDAVGVAAPGPFDYERGICRLRHKLAALYGVDLRAEIASAIGLADRGRVRFVNDADAFLLGEWWAGAARGHARAVGITLGTGLGSAFLEDGRILEAGRGVPPAGSLHLVPWRGAPVEDVISRRGLLERYGARANELDVEQIAERARSGEPRAGETFAEVMATLAEFLLPWLRAFAPTCLVVGGSIARAWDLIEPHLRAGLASVEPLDVTVAASIDDAPLLGAARHAAAAA